METTREIKAAQAEIEYFGYATGIQENGSLVVFDPEHACGSGGRLVLTGYKPVVIRSYLDALKFLEARE